jgi:hypothetical protein
MEYLYCDCRFAICGLGSNEAATTALDSFVGHIYESPWRLSVPKLTLNRSGCGRAAVVKVAGGNHWVRRRLPWSFKSGFRDSLKQGRQVHLYSGTPGRTVWAQSRQTKRPSLWAIIGLKSMPAMQYGQRMIKVVSVSVGIGRSCTGATETGTPDSRCQAR